MTGFNRLDVYECRTVLVSNLPHDWVVTAVFDGGRNYKVVVRNPNRPDALYEVHNQTECRALIKRYGGVRV